MRKWNTEQDAPLPLLTQITHNRAQGFPIDEG